MICSEIASVSTAISSPALDTLACKCTRDEGVHGMGSLYCAVHTSS